MRRLPVSARRYMYAGVAPGAASLARSPLSSLCAHRNGNATPTQGRKEEGKAGADCPHHPQERRGAGGGGEEEDAGSGGALKGQGAVFCLPIFHFPSSTTALRRLI